LSETVTKDAVERGTLPFSMEKQDALLGHMIENDKFFQMVRHHVKPEWFIDPWANKVCAAKLKFVKEMERSPTRSELEHSPEIYLAETRDQTKLKAKINVAILSIKEFGLDVLTKEMKTWMEARRIRLGVEQIQIKYNAGRITEANAVAKEMAKDVDSIQFDDDGEWKFDRYREQFEASQEQRSNALTFGVTAMDRILLPEGSAGGLLPGDHTVFLAPTNVGKTTSMITVLRHNLFRGKNVLLLTHEGRPEDINEKLWCCVLGISKGDLLKMYDVPEKRARLEQVVKMFNTHLTYMPRNKAGMSVQEVDTMIRRQFDKRHASTGSGYDLVVSDYPAKLSYEGAGRWDVRQILDKVYDHLGRMAEEYKFHLLSAIQSNREGARTNKGENGRDRLLTDTDVSEAYGPCQTATNVISINRSPLAESRDRVTYYVCKSRSNQKNFAVVCKSRYGHAMTHSNKFGATWYRGTSTMDEKIDSLLEQHNNEEIDRTKVDADDAA
jgi:replicative DNA helicase